MLLESTAHHLGKIKVIEAGGRSIGSDILDGAPLSLCRSLFGCMGNGLLPFQFGSEFRLRIDNARRRVGARCGGSAGHTASSSLGFVGAFGSIGFRLSVSWPWTGRWIVGHSKVGSLLNSLDSDLAYKDHPCAHQSHPRRNSASLMRKSDTRSFALALQADHTLQADPT